MRSIQSAAAGFAGVLSTAAFALADPVVFTVSESYHSTGQIAFTGYTGTPDRWDAQDRPQLLASVADPQGLRYFASVYLGASRTGSNVYTSTAARSTTDGLLYRPDAMGTADSSLTLLIGSESVPAGIAAHHDGGSVRWSLQDLTAGTPALSGAGEWNGSLEALHTYRFTAHTEHHIIGEAPDTEGNYISFTMYSAQMMPVAAPDAGTLGLLGAGMLLVVRRRT